MDTPRERVNLVYAAKVDLDAGWNAPLVPGQPADVRVRVAADDSGTPQVIHAERLVRNFGSRPALRGIDLAIEKGEMFALIGPDGAGKTTFFRIVAGLLQPTSGRAVRDDVPFGLVPQRFSLYEDLTVDENLALRARLYPCRPPRAARARRTSSAASASTASARVSPARSRAA